MKLKIIFSLVLFPSLMLSQGSSQGAVSLKFPTTPFVAATGESFVADPTALQSILINPANIASRENYGVLFSHTEWIQDIRTECLSIAAPISIGAFSLTIENTSVDGLELRSTPGPAIGTFNAQSAFFQLSYGVEVAPHIRIGVAPKYLYEKIFVEEATGYGIDAGVLYTPPVDGLSLGCSLTNMGSLSAFRNERIDLPTQIRLGATYAFNVDNMIFRAATALSSELGTSTNHYSIGGEVSYDHSVTIRFGYITGIDARGFSAGMGIRYSVVTIDYAYVPFSLQVGNSHLISIGFDL
jgi:hypothetical protein